MTRSPIFTASKQFSIFALLWLVSICNVYAATTNPVTLKENNLKAALIYKMGSYITWAIKPATISYCFIGENSSEIGEILLNKQKNRQFPVPINVFIKTSNKKHEDIESCHLVYISGEEELNKTELEEISRSAFTITSTSKNLPKGFIASLEIQNNKPLLSISKNNLKRSSISVNSRFLSHINLL